MVNIVWKENTPFYLWYSALNHALGLNMLNAGCVCDLPSQKNWKRRQAKQTAQSSRMSALTTTNPKRYIHRWMLCRKGPVCGWGPEIINSHNVEWKLSGDLVSPGLPSSARPSLRLPALLWKSLRRSFVTLEGYLILVDFFSLSLSQHFAPVLNFLSETNFLWKQKTLAHMILLMFRMLDIKSVHV